MVHNTTDMTVETKRPEACEDTYRGLAPLSMHLSKEEGEPWLIATAWLILRQLPTFCQ